MSNFHLISYREIKYLIASATAIITPSTNRTPAEISSVVAPKIIAPIVPKQSIPS